ncbi:MAG: MerR family transcriptional regulator, partial [Actinobacteria bacterium]|nr:MerR family transcriptional regulator [Actinomycetota bacterium]
MDAMENLIPIGQFAAASRLSPKALRLYDENGLLPPAVVDPDSGYRFYRLEQLRSATLIGLLRSAGMPLVEIRRVLDDPDPVGRAARIDEYDEALAGELAERRRVLDFVRRFIEEEQMFEVQVKQVPEIPYVSRSKRVRVAELEPFIVDTIRELWEAHEPAGSAFTLYHGEVNEEADGPVEVCVPVAEAEKRLPATEVAYTVAVGSECRFPEIIGAYDAVAGWAKRLGRELDGAPREIYLSDPDAGE